MNTNKKKSMIILFITSLIFSLIVPYNNVYGATQKESITSTELYEELLLDENIDLVNIDYSADNVGIEVSVDSEVGEIKDTTVAIDIDPGNDQLSVVSENSENEIEEYKVVIEKLDEYGMQATYTSMETGEIFIYDSSVATPTVLFAIPWGITLSAKAISVLYAAGAVLLVGTVAYIEVNNFINKEKKRYNHYVATVDKKSKKLFIGSGLSKTSAVNRLKSKNNTWSTSKTNAQTIAKEASPIKKVTAAEVSNGKNMVWHYHPLSGYDRNGKGIRIEGAHAFYGSAK
ncbi:hypothetical protein QUF94_22720 [Peribacillus sp. NJ4]|uniref:hypothetical protein n=1 Tax=Peribacillus sp. NJ4 TaxID=3055862 RepID=UPI0025A19DCF|nr:hypothetical protein [Peribacillus sp. NJ4]MDM5214216.1 hypothetical protein [Peribacillus sp. NJ4]